MDDIFNGLIEVCHGSNNGAVFSTGFGDQANIVMLLQHVACGLGTAGKNHMADIWVGSKPCCQTVIAAGNKLQHIF